MCGAAYGTAPDSGETILYRKEATEACLGEGHEVD